MWGQCEFPGCLFYSSISPYGLGGEVRQCPLPCGRRLSHLLSFLQTHGLGYFVHWSLVPHVWLEHRWILEFRFELNFEECIRSLD